MEKNKKVKVHKKLKKWEKVFILMNLGIICIISGIYSYRLVFFYIEEHPAVKDTRLLTEIEKHVYSKKGLYEDNKNKNNYYYKGKDVNNYVYYSNRLFRIISVTDNGIKMITDDSQTTIAWGNTNDYNNSYIYRWLNITDKDNSGIFLKSLSNYENLLVKNKYCMDIIEDITKPTCKTTKEDYVGLIDIDEYITSGGSTGFLNNNTYYWTINGAKDNKIWYVFNEGGINYDSVQNGTYLSYGVRPVITMNKNVKYNKGTGTLNDPYVIDDTNIAGIGSYIKYSDNIWKIQNKTEDYYKVLLDGNLLENDKEYKTNYNNVQNYLNKFYDKLDKTGITNCNYYTGTYTKNDYSSIYKSSQSKNISLPSIGELFVNEYKDTWLLNKYNSTLAYITTNNSLLADSINSSNSIRPSVCIKSDIKINSGDGTKTNPYIMEVNNETNN